MYMYQLPDWKPEEIVDYLRKSRSDDPLETVQEVLSKHERMLDEWSLQHIGSVVPEENKYREVASGEHLSERPKIQAVLRRIESPAIKAIKVVEPQRLTRGDLEDIGHLMKLLKHTGTQVITLQRVYNLQDEYDWDAFERELKRGNDFLEYTKKILTRGRLLSVSQGNYIGSIAPYGYNITYVMDGRRKCPVLTPDPEESQVIQQIFDMYVRQNMGCQNICYALDQQGIKPRKGQHWSQAAVSKMLENVHYIGKVRWNRRKAHIVVEDGEFIKTRPIAKEGEYLIYEGKHPAIIDEELFRAAQEKKGRNPRAKAKLRVRNPFAGLLWCQCGRAMSLRTYVGRPVAPRMICDGQSYCRTGSCTYDEIEARVEGILQECISDFSLQLRQNDEHAVELSRQTINRLERRLKELDEKELAQWEQQSHPDPSQRMPAHIFQQLKEKLQKEKEDTAQALKVARETMPHPEEYREKMSRFQEALNALQDPGMSAAEKNRLLKLCIEKIIYQRERPERLRNDEKRVYEKGHYKKPHPLSVGSSWTTPAIELQVQLRI